MTRTQIKINLKNDSKNTAVKIKPRNKINNVDDAKFWDQNKYKKGLEVEGETVGKTHFYFILCQLFIKLVNAESAKLTEIFVILVKYYNIYITINKTY